MPAKSASPASDESPLERLAISPPRFTVLSDHPLAAEDYARDSFGLERRLGPVFDILRHPETKTPLAVAVYGPWGSGKTSAMRVLEGMAKTSNKHGAPPRDKTKKKIKLRSVWFYPWKYHTGEEVCKGLISEVILACTDVKRASPKKIATALQQFGGFLGKTFINALTSPKLKVALPAGPGAEIDLRDLKEKVVSDFLAVAHPEKPFLNEFEYALEKWVKRSVTAKSRLVVFIDDLDRCMPDVALDVLEALKLYLNIPRLVFVVGVDKQVIDALVQKHYKGLGLKEGQSAHYLAKMFQVEVTLGASEPQISDFLNETISAVSFDEADLEREHRDTITAVIGSLAGSNPREVKRLVSSSVMLGAGSVLASPDDSDSDAPLLFAQGIQFFLVHRILDTKFGRGHLAFSEAARSFFREWSTICCANLDRACYIPEAALVVADEPDLPPTSSLRELHEKRKQVQREKPPDDYDHFDELWNDPRFMKYHPFLGNRNLGELMKIKFPSAEDAAEIADAMVTATPAPQPSDEDIILDVVAAKLGKRRQDLTDKDLVNVQALDLRFKKISDISVLEKLSQLTRLYLSGTSVSDISVLEKLQQLDELALSGTSVTDISVLEKLSQLTRLYLSRTAVSDISALEKLPQLTTLYLAHTNVSPEDAERFKKDHPDCNVDH